MEEEQNNEQTAQSQQESSALRYDLPSTRSGGSKFFWLVLALAIVAVVAGGFMFLGSRQGQEEEAAPSPTPTQALTPTPTSPPSGGSPTPTSKPSPTEKPSPTPTKKPTKGLSVRVLNGSGVTGAAKEAADYLSSLGYEIAGTGNAATSDFENTTINIKAAKESLLPQLKIDLQTKYTIGTTSATLSATDSANAVVTVGKK